MYLHNLLRQLDEDWTQRFSDSPMFESRGAFQAAPLKPAMDVVARGEELVLFVELPGVEPDSLDVEVVDETMTLRARRAEPTLNDGERYLRRERRGGDVMRALQLPFRVEADQIEAHYRNGILEVRLPRRVADRPRRINVRVSEGDAPQPREAITETNDATVTGEGETGNGNGNGNGNRNGNR